MAVLRSTWNSVDDLNDVEKAMHEAGFIVEGEGGKLHLDGVEGFDPKTKTKEFRDQNIDLRRELEKTHEKYKGALTAAEKAEYDAEMQDLRDKAALGDDHERIKELVEKRLVPVTIGDREVKVDRSSKAAIEAHLTALTGNLKGLEATSTTLSAELRKERGDGAARAAYLKLPGHRPNAADDVVRYFREKVVFDENYRPYIPDPDAAPVEGELPPALVGTDGKPVGIEAHMQQIAESGEKAGVWFDAPGGPPATGSRRPGHRSQPGELHGADLISDEMRKRAAA